MRHLFHSSLLRPLTHMRPPITLAGRTGLRSVDGYASRISPATQQEIMSRAVSCVIRLDVTAPPYVGTEMPVVQGAGGSDGQTCVNAPYSIEQAVTDPASITRHFIQAFQEGIHADSPLLASCGSNTLRRLYSDKALRYGRSLSARRVCSIRPSAPSLERASEPPRGTRGLDTLH